MSTHNPEDTTTLLWDYYFHVKLPYLQTMSEDYMRVHGMPCSGSREVDQEVANSWFDTMISIAAMVDHFKNGVNVRVVKQSDTKLIYDYISRHLESWKTHLQYGINLGDAPIEDLIAMDQFANAVYEYAKYHFTQETLTSIFGRDMSNVLGFTPGTFFKPGTMKSSHLPSERAASKLVNTLVDRVEENKVPERASMASFLKTNLGSLKRWK